MLISPVYLELHWCLFNTFITTSTRALVIAESTISTILGAALLVIVVPLLMLFLVDVLGYVSGMILKKMAQHSIRYFGNGPVSSPIGVGVVFKMESLIAIKDVLDALRSLNLVPPMIGFWLRMKDEEHS